MESSKKPTSFSQGTKPSILWYSNSPNTNSGYGICAKHILRGLKERGYEVGMASNFGIYGSPIELDGYPVFPTGSGLSEYEATQIFLKFEYDLLITQYDVFPLDTLAHLVQQHRIPWVCYATLDHPEIYPWVKNKLNAAAYIVAMSDYGLNLLKKNSYDGTRIHHGVDTKVFKPIIGEAEGTKITKEILKRELKFPEDCFLIFINKMNKGNRVGYPYMLEGIKIFMENNPDIKIHTLLHTATNWPNGYPLDRLINRLGLTDYIRTTAAFDYFLGLTEIQLAKMYNAADVQLHCTLSESFGMPIIEAISCGIPVIGTDCSSITELIKPTCAELLVPTVTNLWEPVPLEYWVPDKYKIADALEKSLSRNPEQDRKNLHDYAVKMWDWESVILPQWDNVLSEIVPETLEKKCFKQPVSEEFAKVAKEVLLCE